MTFAPRIDLMEVWTDRIMKDLQQSGLRVGEIRLVLLSMTTAVVASSEPTYERAAEHFERAKEEMRDAWLMPELADNRAKLINMAIDSAEEALRP